MSAPFDKTQSLLRVWVVDDLKTMTFRMLAREMSINVNEAKIALATFLSANSSDVHPTWILTGSLIPPPSESASMDVDGEDGVGGKAVRMGVLLCTENDVELKKTLFHPETLSQHVYSLDPGLLRDPATLIKTSTALRSHPKYLRPEVYGTSVSPSISSGPAHKTSTAAAAAVPAPLAKTKSKEAPAAASAAEKAKPKMTAGKLDFSKNQSKEQKEEKKAVDEKAKASLKRKSSPTGGAAKPSTTISVSKPAPDSPPPKASTKAKAKKRAVISDDEEDEEEDIAPKKAEGSTKKKLTKAEMEAEMAGLDSIWDDDMDVDENGEEIVKAAPTKKKSLITPASDSESESAPPPKAAATMAAAPKKKAVLAGGSDDEADDVKPTAKALSAAAAKGGKKKVPAKGEEIRDAQGRLRKVRRVVKTVQGKNKRGYDVEEDVSAEESYYTSEDEAPPPRPKTKATTSSTSVSSAGDTKEKKPMQKVEKKPVGKKATGQASISSFFGKK